MLTRTTSITFLGRALTILLALASLSFGPPVHAAEKLHPEQVANLLPQLLQMHLKQHDMDIAFMRRMLKEYVEQLDPSRSFYLKNEAEAIISMNDEQLKKLSQQSIDGDFSQFNTIFKEFQEKQLVRADALYAGLEKRIDEIKALAKEKAEARKTASTEKPEIDPKANKELLTNDPNKTDPVADDANDDPDKIKWTERPLTNEERERRLLRRSAALYAINKEYLSETESFKQMLLIIRQEHDKWQNVNMEEQVSKLFLKSFMLAMDPHSDYLEGEDEEDFANHMERSFAGIGVQIRPCPMGAQVEDVIKGGPSDKSQKFARGDQIIEVDNVALAGMPINKIVKLIKGEKGTEVKIRLFKRETQTTDIVAIHRDTIQLADIRVKGKTYESPAGPIGLISVAAFYQGVHNDVHDRLNELSKDKPLAGVVLDLRSNTGGFLEEAIDLAGLFIKSGYVVGERDAHNKIAWQQDPDPEIAFKGPLVILTNQFSASASEIVTGSLKDYGRAIVAAHTQTFGKGTVQRLLSLNPLHLPGEIKVTTDQYFLAGGASVQLKGVEPDVVIPGVKLMDEEGFLERATANAIPFNEIPGKLDKTQPEVKMWMDWKTNNLAMLQQKSKARVDANPELRDFFDPKKRKAKADEKEAKEEKPLNPDVAPKPVDKKDEPDPQADEAVAIIKDMISSWPNLDKVGAK